MIHSGEERTNGIRCRFNPSIGINFQGAKMSSDTGILLLREIDERFGITSALERILQDSRNVSQTQHSCTDLLRQRVYQIAAGYDDCNDGNELRKDPALRLALDKNNTYAASQSLLSRFENEILGNRQGLQVCFINQIRRFNYVSRKRQQTGLHFRSIRIFRPKTLLRT